MGTALHRLQAQGRARLSDRDPAERPGRAADVRIGSATKGLAPASIQRPLAARAPQWAGLAAVALAATLADQLTKHIVSARVALEDEVHVIGPLSLHHVQNSGIAFGLFPTATSAVIVLTALAVCWMLVFFARSGSRHPLLPASLGLLIGGSASNLVDRVRLGHVTDFLDLRFWPAFNLADTFIVVGVAVLLMALLAAEREPARRRPVEKATPAGP